MAVSYTKEFSDVVDAIREKKDVISFKRDEALMKKYCLWILVQAQKNRKLILANNKRQNEPDAETDDLRDQGYVRPRCLVLLPFRDTAYRFINTLISVFESGLGSDQKIAVSFKKRFRREFGPQAEDEGKLQGRKPADYEAIFGGNDDDHFALGVALAKRTVKLMVPFESADIIVASPIRLSRLISDWQVARGEKATEKKKGNEDEEDMEVEEMEDEDDDGEEGEGKGKKKERVTCDPEAMLSSIELLVIDFADVLYMQNWMHVMTVVELLNRTPQVLPSSANLFRCRTEFLEGRGAERRQTLLFSRHLLGSLRHHLEPHLKNAAGRLECAPDLLEPLAACPDLWEMPGVAVERFRVACGPVTSDARLASFRRALLPELKRAGQPGVLIFAGTPADRLKLHKLLHVEEQLDVAFLHEEMTPAKQQSARHRFQLGRVRILVLSERLHFYRRWRLRGVRSLLFFRLPAFPHFLPELCRMAERPAGGQVSCQLLVDARDPQDMFAYARLFGAEKAKGLLT